MVPHTNAEKMMHDVIKSTLKGIRPNSLTKLRIHRIQCSAEVFEQFLDSALNLVDPERGLLYLSISLLRGMILSEHIITKIVSCCKRLEALILINDPESNWASRNSLIKLGTQIISGMRPIACLRRTSLTVLDVGGFSCSDAE